MSPYREPAPPCLLPILLPVLREEYEEAKTHQGGLIGCAVIAACAGAVSTSIGIADRAAAALPFVVVSLGTVALCLVSFWRGRRTIRHWRDQERRRIAVCGKDGTC